MEVIRDFQDLSKKDVRIAGGKGASLGEMSQAGIPVPPGFVILATAFEKFLKDMNLDSKIDLILNSVNYKDIHIVVNASKKIRKLILNSEIPKYIADDVERSFKKLNTKYVAVRSSATAEDSASAAWAGQLESFLNTTKEDLLGNVKRCWASLFTPRAIFYRFEKKLAKQKISVAVVIQKMVESEISGIAFSVHPVTQDNNQLIIEAGFGLGEAIVSGKITPDNYIIRKKPRIIIQRNVKKKNKGLYRAKKHGNEWRGIPKAKIEKQALSDNQILKLSNIIISIENHYNFPCDIEWAVEKNKFYIVQSRPITTLTQKSEVATLEKKEELKKYRQEYSIGDIIKIMKANKWSIQEFNGMPLYLHCAATESGWLVNEKFGRSYSHFFYLFSNGRAYMYYDLKDWERMCNLFYKKVRNEKDFLRLKNEYQNKYEKYKKDTEYRRSSLSKLKTQDLVAFAQKALKRIIRATDFSHIIEGVTYGSEIALKKTLRKNRKFNEMDFSVLCSPITPSFLLEAQRKLLEIKNAKNKKRLIKEYLDNFSFVQTTYLGPKLIARNDVLKLADNVSRDSIGTNYGQVLSRKKELIKKYGVNKRGQFIIRIIELCFAWQDNRKRHILQSVYHAEPVFFEVARRFNITIQSLKFACPHEINFQQLSNPEFRTMLEERRKKSAVYIIEKGYSVFTGENFDTIAGALNITFSEKKKELRGVTASTGYAKGMVQICDSVSDIDKFKTGDILVASMTRPEYLPAMQKAAAFITNEGGITCHAAIASREMKKPCIISTKIATQILKDGDLVEVDADIGVVRILNNKKKQNKFKLIWDRDRMYLFPWYLAEQCLTDDIGDIFSKKINKTLLEFRRGHLFSYMDTEQLNDIGKFLFEKVKNDKRFYRIVEKNILRTGNDLMNFCNKIRKSKYTFQPNERLAKIYNDYSKKIKTMRAWGWVPPLIDGLRTSFLSDHIQEKFRRFLKSTNEKNKTAEYYSILSSSEKMSEIQVEEIAKLNLIKKIKGFDANLLKSLIQNIGKFIPRVRRIPVVFNAIRNHAKKFGWLTYGYMGPAMSEADIINLMRDSLKQENSIEKQIRDIKKHYTELKQNKKIIINKIKLPSELKYLFEVSAFFMHLKDLRKGIYQKSYVIMDPVLEEIAKRVNLTIEEVKYLTQTEISEALVAGKDFSSVCRKRKKYCVTITENGKSEVYHGIKAKQIIAEEAQLDEVDYGIKELKGLTAFAGKVTGVAKIISIVKDIPKIKKGEILISPSTNPDLILAMKKAAAFVTDMGGITSHAAIASREMKKPCIVGTRIATKVIRDGDLVEVDANNGTVKILKR